jgi:hypothetical protein
MKTYIVMVVASVSGIYWRFESRVVGIIGKVIRLPPFATPTRPVRAAPISIPVKIVPIK